MKVFSFKQVQMLLLNQMLITKTVFERVGWRVALDGLISW